MRSVEYCPSPYAHRVLIEGKILAPEEQPQEMFERVVETLFSVESTFGTPPKEIQQVKEAFARFMAEKAFTPGTPTLTNAGRVGYENSALCSCALIPVDLWRKEESAEMIKAYYRQNMGSGFDLTPYANPVELLIWLNDLAAQETLTGQYDRYIGNMANLHVASPHIEEYVTIKTERRLPHFNVSVIVDDDFMEAARRGGSYNMMDGASINAHNLLSLMAESAWICGEPSLINLGRMNQDNPLPDLAPYVSAPPCSEMGLAVGETCQFIYINISKFTTPSGVDHEKLGEVTRVVTRALDNAIELGLGKFPHPASTEVARLKRKIGIAASGLADTLLYYDLPYDSDEARTLARDVLSYINYSSKVASVELASERGPCEAMAYTEGNRYYKRYLEDRFGAGTNTVSAEQWERLGEHIRKTGQLRNLLTTTLPPAARVSILMDASFGIEPIFGVPSRVDDLRSSVKDFVTRHAGDRTQAILEQAVQEGTFQNVDLLGKECLKTATEISYQDHLKMVAALVGKGGVVDEAASKTVNLPKDATSEDILDVFLLSDELGLKNIAVYREGSYEDQPLKL